MGKSRLEAFSDGVLAIIITIMVLEFRVPHGASITALAPLLPAVLSYVLSFVYLGIYWNNHHHMFLACKKVSGRVLWANLHLLFWLSLLPFATHWMGENPSSPMPSALYGVISFVLPSHTGCFSRLSSLLRVPARRSQRQSGAIGRASCRHFCISGASRQQLGYRGLRKESMPSLRYCGLYPTGASSARSPKARPSFDTDPPLTESLRLQNRFMANDEQSDRLELPARAIGAPTTVSAEARRFLATPRPPFPPWPALDDVAGWREAIKRSNEIFAPIHEAHRQNFAGDLQERKIGNVDTYELVPRSIPERNRNRVPVVSARWRLRVRRRSLAGTGAIPMASAGGYRTFSPDYRMPPDHPFPAALDDAVAVYRALLETFAPRASASLVFRREAGSRPRPSSRRATTVCLCQRRRSY